MKGKGKVDWGPHDPIEGYDKPFSQKKQFIQFKDSPPLTSIKKTASCLLHCLSQH